MLIAIISSPMPKHSHIIPIAVFFAHKNHNKETIIHVIDKINKALLLVFIIITSVKFKFVSLALTAPLASPGGKLSPPQGGD